MPKNTKAHRDGADIVAPFKREAGSLTTHPLSGAIPKPLCQTFELPSASLHRVLFVAHTSQLGGAELVLLDVARTIAARSTIWLFEDGPLRTRLESAGLRTILSKRPNNLRGIRRDQSLLHALPSFGDMASIAMGIAETARQHDIVYANSQKAFVLASFAARLVRRPLIWHLHDILSPTHFGRGQRRLTTFLANRFATRVIVPSAAAASAFAEAGGSREKLTIVANGVTFEDTPTNPRDRAEVRAMLGLTEDFTFGVFSRLAPWKGQHVALEALRRLERGYCVIAGDALFGEDGYAAHLRQVAVQLGVSDRVRFLGHRNDVPRLMRGVDAVVHPSVQPEPFGRTIVEAMLCRTPVVGADAGAVSEILDGGTAGLLVPPGDPQALARALESLRENPMMAARLVEAAATRAQLVFTVARMCNGIEAVLRTIPC
jgi:glycosyltransferase involved in cell wall biosynthesis